MRDLRQFLSQRRALCAILVAATLLLRAAIPGGMMPAVSASGGLSVVICDGHGDATRVSMPLPDKPVAPSDHPCPYVALAHALLAPPPILPIAPRQQAATQLMGRAALAPAPASPSYLLPPARAPPGYA